MINLKETALGIEFGSTRIKAVLVDKQNKILALGTFDWENEYRDEIWTYDLDNAVQGMQVCFARLAETFFQDYGQRLVEVGSIGISGMMHGYLAFDSNNKLLVPFRTWRNTNAKQAAAQLSDIFDYHIPERWSVAHLYDAILHKEKHVKHIAYVTTLAGYVHWRLTGCKVLGIGDASGMFPIDSASKDYDVFKANQFNGILKRNGLGFDLSAIFPTVLTCGEYAGLLTKEGAELLDPKGDLVCGIPLCPPEGDAGTGMVATNCAEEGTGNISAGTSIFAMIVLDKQPDFFLREVDFVTTPVGDPVAMVHCNNCTSDINAWVGLINEAMELFNTKISKNELFERLFKSSLTADNDCDGIVEYNFLSAESLVDVPKGIPLIVRDTESVLSLPNFMRSLIYGSFSALIIGIDKFIQKQHISISKMRAHGGLFKNGSIVQSFLASALNCPVSTTSNAGEGGAWGMAILANYSLQKDITLKEYIKKTAFCESEEETVYPVVEISNGYKKYLKKYKERLSCVKEACNIQ